MKRQRTPTNTSPRMHAGKSAKHHETRPGVAEVASIRESVIPHRRAFVPRALKGLLILAALALGFVGPKPTLSFACLPPYCGPVLAGLSLSATTVTGGNSVTGTVSL